MPSIRLLVTTNPVALSPSAEYFNSLLTTGASSVQQDVGVLITFCAMLYLIGGSHRRLSPPTFESDRDKDTFVVTFLFHHFLSPEDVTWLGNFADLELSEDEQRALVFVREVGAINNSAYRDLNRVETLIASGHLRRLRDAGLLDQRGKAAATYYVPTERLLDPMGAGGLATTIGKSQSPQPTPATSGQSQGFPKLPQGFPALPQELSAAIAGLGDRARPSEAKSVIRRLCAWRSLRAEEVAALLRRGQPYVTRTYLAPMVRDGELEFIYPDQPAHPQQAYKAK